MKFITFCKAFCVYICLKKKKKPGNIFNFKVNLQNVFSIFLGDYLIMWVLSPGVMKRYLQCKQVTWQTGARLSSSAFCYTDLYLYLCLYLYLYLYL